MAAGTPARGTARSDSNTPAERHPAGVFLGGGGSDGIAGRRGSESLHGGGDFAREFLGERPGERFGLGLERSAAAGGQEGGGDEAVGYVDAEIGLGAPDPAPSRPPRADSSARKSHSARPDPSGAKLYRRKRAIMRGHEPVPAPPCRADALPWLRKGLSIVAFLLVLAVLAAVAFRSTRLITGEGPAGTGRYNVLLITVRHAARRSPSDATGYSAAQTPVMDRLAGDGVLFERAETAALFNVAGARFYSDGDLSGLSRRANGVYRLGPRAVTLAEVLQPSGGYATGAAISGYPLTASGCPRASTTTAPHPPPQAGRGHWFPRAARRGGRTARATGSRAAPLLPRLHFRIRYCALRSPSPSASPSLPMTARWPTSTRRLAGAGEAGGHRAVLTRRVVLSVLRRGPGREATQTQVFL